jgi:hypothetical protein
MKFLPMYENTPGMPDLVHHTVKHFLSDRERAEWDRVPAGTRTASGAWWDLRSAGKRTPLRGRFPATEWWEAPWIAHVRQAHNEGYRPRYELLLNHVGHPDGARWQNASKGRRLTEHLGFRLVVEASAQNFQVVTAFYGAGCIGAGGFHVALPALRAFAARQNCPPAGPSGVGRGRDEVMNERTERARHLGEQLATAMDALGTATRGHDVVTFLDRLARLETYPAEELAIVPGLLALVSEAASARKEHGAELGEVAGHAFDLDQLLDIGRHLPAEDLAAERDAWLRDVLVLATVAPWLSAPRHRQVAWALEKSRAMVEADAEAFLDASVLVSDRRALEAPNGLGDEARALLQVLADLPLIVAFERAPARTSVRRVDSVLGRIDPALVDAVDDALADHDHRQAIRLPSTSERQALAAADDAHGTLVRMEGGRWVLIRHRGSLRLRFEGEEADLGVWIVEGAEPVDLPADEGGGYLLPASDEGLTLRLRVGPDSRIVRIDAHPS